jgi:purine-nucleoside phosphorylase
MSEFITLPEIDNLANTIRSLTIHKPQVGLILGSGLGALAEAIQNPDVIPYGQLPGWPVSTVLGHAGQLVIGLLEGKTVLILQGRVHYYEGYSMAKIGLPVRVMQRLGIQTLIVTNAAGSVNPAFEPGDLMLITDHLNLIGMAGLTPLRGPNLDEIGPRFPDMSRAYDPSLCQLSRQVAKRDNLPLHEGVYAWQGLHLRPRLIYASCG